MTVKEIRNTFLSFFENKGHKIVPSAPLVNKYDPTLMFTNAGMNPFKDFFLGHKRSEFPRIADTQKCLRVSGKHNDLEEVGLDGYHHTMFEMLGNWSFGDYFKEEAIRWAWELLTDFYQLDKDRLYVSIFGGDVQDGLDADEEAYEIWQTLVPKDRILRFGKGDNFWEMGDTGPCGPCSEIHIDLRSDEERKEVEGKTLVNADHPDVIEIWNLVFIEFNRKVNGSLEVLPEKHIDTGMGLERLCRAIQKKGSNYETDVFMPYIKQLETLTRKVYTASYNPTDKSDVAFRVIVDHLRAVAFSIADGQLPSNTGAGYVIRRILRRAVRYYYTFLGYDEPLIYLLVPELASQMGDIFPEISQQVDLVSSVIKDEEQAFLRTLDSGLKRITKLSNKAGVWSGADVFELFDTYGFPVDLTRLIAKEQGFTIDEVGFERALESQKLRSKSDAQSVFGDWHILLPDIHPQFVGYDDFLVRDARVVKFRTVERKGKPSFHLVFDKTPFYAESGGQIGDIGWISSSQEKIQILNTFKENDLIIHEAEKLPSDPSARFLMDINIDRRKNIERNHSATHLLHAALRQILGYHVQQKGSLVHHDYLRFDFSHFQKLNEDELNRIEDLVNTKILQNIPRGEFRDIPMEEAKEAGAMMLFGEKYGDTVRMITFDPEFSIELCGGCHVERTGSIGYFRILSESSIATGIRRIEAVTGMKAIAVARDQSKILKEVGQLLKNPKDPVKAVSDLLDELKYLRKDIELLHMKHMNEIKNNFWSNRIIIGKSAIVSGIVEIPENKIVKSLAYELGNLGSSYGIVIGNIADQKPSIVVLLSNDLVDKGLHAGNLVKMGAKWINGGGGGQPFFATAGGSEASGLKDAIHSIVESIKSHLPVLT